MHPFIPSVRRSVSEPTARSLVVRYLRYWNARNAAIKIRAVTTPCATAKNGLSAAKEVASKQRYAAPARMLLMTAIMLAAVLKKATSELDNERTWLTGTRSARWSTQL